mmetsp:Transcript_26391/g.87508  ORF Transcript_26391/g.87508 Transcript_26391/m.87508 type:complete len:239 (+) Transcript_26391:159-875(+)|eukprot:CAMPEP_0203963448 /NCGR_PEP_ID=MMETSP0359-20131031/93397_1 /ASSEMBLY_ACC=CAM_ASM_000338 /TAXON_ID=268821 /ORGANISM="Scrippsiella Hangoei, Strain SHTV-5" /LENGTH=238 /DNA_ID=CAMNT_0050899289 /DNA_START=78 /DNA_END=794 /DNA_ORIENTATION=-
MGVAESLRTVKLLLRAAGAIVSALFLVQAVWIIINPNVEDFWEFNHWLGQAILGLAVGGFGCYMEVRGTMQSIASSFTSFAMNRIGLFVFYFWLGCYVMGGMGVVGIGESWRTVAHITGVISWIVAVGDLLISCTAVGREPDLPVLQPSPKDAQKVPPDSPSPDTYGIELGDVNPHGGSDSPRTKWPARNPELPRGSGPFDTTTDIPGPAAEPEDVNPTVEDQPVWNNSAFQKPFGCA